VVGSEQGGSREGESREQGGSKEGESREGSYGSPIIKVSVKNSKIKSKTENNSDARLHHFFLVVKLHGAKNGKNFGT
jgi:hypothetical protein